MHNAATAGSQFRSQIQFQFSFYRGDFWGDQGAESPLLELFITLGG